MTDRKIQQACLTAYTEALENLPSNFEDALEYLNERNMGKGICAYIRDEMGVNEHLIWIKDVLNDLNERIFWSPPPNWANNTLGIRRSLQFRINKLKEILKQ